MAKDAKEERLRSMALFKGANDEAIRNLASAADEVTVRAGHVLIRQGHHHQEMYVIESGSATVEIDGREVATIPAGEFVGELSYFNRSPASATVTTSEESSVLVVPYNRFEQVMDDNPMFVRALVAELAERLDATDAKLKSLGG
jgi:CRP-like cAMP-binding protein